MPYRKHVNETSNTRREQAADKRRKADSLRDRGLVDDAQKEKTMADMLENQAGITRRMNR